MDIQNGEFMVNITMLGGSRSGKTSTLAVMDRNFNEIYSKSDLKIVKADDPVMERLANKWGEIHHYYGSRYSYRRSFLPDNSPTIDEKVYRFEVSLKGKNMNPMCLDFTDFPGEWLDDENHTADVKNIVNRSSVILCTIDTPYLMEYCETTEIKETGAFNEVQNYSECICNILKENLESQYERRILIFIPIKCEKYLHSGRINEVYEKIKYAYREIISPLTSYVYRDKYEVLISPIETFGTTRFSRFEMANGEIVLNEKGKPARALYTFDDDAKPYPEPKNCEIPFEMVLLYLLTEAKKYCPNSLNKKGFLERIFGGKEDKKEKALPTVDELDAQEVIIREHLSKKFKNNEIYLISDPYRINVLK